MYHSFKYTILSVMYSIMNYIIQIHVLVIRWLTLEIVMQLILLIIFQVFFFSRVKGTSAYALHICYVYTLLLL